MRARPFPSLFALYARLVIWLRYPVLVGVLVLLGHAISQLPKVKFNTSIHPLMEASKDQLQAVRDFRRALPPMRAHLLCSVEWPNAIGQTELEELAALESRAKEGDGIQRTLSLASVSVLASPLGVPVPVRFLDEHREETARQRVERHPLFRRWLLSEDGKAAVVLVYFKKGGRLDAIEAHLRQVAPSGARLHFFAGQSVDDTILRTMERDLKRGLGLELVLVTLVMALLFRTLRGVLISVSAPAVAVILFLNLSRWLGALSIIELAVPGLLLVIGLCDSIHLVCAFEETRRDGTARYEAIIQTMAHVGNACLWTSVTTAMGFLSLLLADHAAIRSLGRTAAVGVGLAFVTVVTLVPLLLALWPTRPAVPPAAWLGRATCLIGTRTGRIVEVLLALFMLAGLARLTVDSRWLEELPADDPVVQEMSWYEAHIGGILDIELHVRGPVGEPASIRALEALQEAVCREPGVTRAESYTLWAREIAGNDANASDAQLALAMTMLKAAGDLFPRYLLTPDLTEARICFQARDMSSQRYLHLKRVLDGLIAGLPPGLEAEVAGYDRMAHESTRLVVVTMLQGFVVTLVAVCVLIGVIFRSWRVGLIAVLPNALPILCALGLTGWLGIELRIGVVMVFCIGVGLAVDDTIHILSRFVEESRRTPEAPVGDRVAAALSITGSALFVTSAVLAIAALCHLPAGLRSCRDTGIILATIVVVAYVADVVLLPRLIVRFLRNQRWG